MILTVEVQRGIKEGKVDLGEVAITFDREGLEELIESLDMFRDKDSDHDHLMSAAWIGEENAELTNRDEIPHEGFEFVHHLRLVKVP